MLECAAMVCRGVEDELQDVLAEREIVLSFMQVVGVCR